jgi:hypothetical protein
MMIITIDYEIFNPVIKCVKNSSIDKVLCDSLIFYN